MMMTLGARRDWHPWDAEHYDGGWKRGT
jgi:hypothetical protein